MALTVEQQSQVDLADAIENSRHANQMELQAANAAIAAASAKLETLRIAQVTLIENSRSKPADQREVTAADIIAFASTLDSAV